MDQENNVVAVPLCVLGLDTERAGGIHFFPPSSLEDNHHAVKSLHLTESPWAGTLLSSPSQSPHQQPTWTARLLGLGKQTWSFQANKVKFPLRSENPINGDLLDGPVIKNLLSNVGDMSLIPARGTKIPHAAGQQSPHIATAEPVHNYETHTHNERSCTLQLRPTQSKIIIFKRSEITQLG